MLDAMTRNKGSNDAKWIVAIFAAIAFAGGVAAVVAVGVGEYGVTRVKQLASDSKTEEERTEAKRYALQALSRHGIRSLARECSADYEDGQWWIHGKAINRDKRVSEVSVFFNVATSGRTTRWELVSGEVDGAVFGP